METTKEKIKVIDRLIKGITEKYDVRNYGDLYCMGYYDALCEMKYLLKREYNDGKIIFSPQ